MPNISHQNPEWVKMQGDFAAATKFKPPLPSGPPPGAQAAKANPKAPTTQIPLHRSKLRPLSLIPWFGRVEPCRTPLHQTTSTSRPRPASKLTTPTHKLEPANLLFPPQAALAKQFSPSLLSVAGTPGMCHTLSCLMLVSTSAINFYNSKTTCGDSMVSLNIVTFHASCQFASVATI